MQTQHKNSRHRLTLAVGDIWCMNHGFGGKPAEYQVMQRLPDMLILYRLSTGNKDERNRWYAAGGGRPGIWSLDDA